MTDGTAGRGFGEASAAVVAGLLRALNARIKPRSGHFEQEGYDSKEKWKRGLGRWSTRRCSFGSALMDHQAYS